MSLAFKCYPIAEQVMLLAKSPTLRVLSCASLVLEIPL